MVTMTNKTATSDYNNSLAGLYAQANGLKWIDIQIPPPIEDAKSAVIDAVNQAGEGGAIVLNYTPPEGLKILNAAKDLGLIDKVIWGSSTPLNDNSVAAALGSAWANKLNVNAELSLLDDPRPEMQLYRDVSKKYNPDAPLGSFQQMGFMIGRIIVKTLMDMPAADVDDPAKVNAAIKGIKNFDTHIVCKPWYFGALADGNVPNNYDYNVVPNGTDTMVLDKDCFKIAEVEPILTAARKAEVAQGLNVG
jgi:branched-chain amino acid transport system substrate-binding protein